MASEAIDQGVDRREFLRAAAVTLVGATAAGSGATLLLDKNKAPLTTLPVPNVPQPVQAAQQGGQQTAQLLSRLAAAQAENLRLQSQLQSAQRQLEAARTPATGREDPAVEALQRQLDEANGQVELLGGKVGVLGGLVAFYEQLDELDLVAVVDEGLSDVGDVLSGLMEQVPSLSEGIEAGYEALSDFEAYVPTLDSGRRWLRSQMRRITAAHEAVERALAPAVEATGSFLQMLDEWVKDILKWLPFGIGDRAAAILAAVGDVLVEVPQTVSQLEIRVASPLDSWLEPEEGETPLQKRLIKPVRERALSPAEKTATAAQQVHSVYQERLAAPAQTVVESQRAVRVLIADYKERHAL